MKTLNHIITHFFLFFFVYSQPILADTVSLVSKINNATSSSSSSDIIKYKGQLFLNVEQGLSIYSENTNQIESIKDAQTNASITTPSQFYVHDSTLYFLNITENQIVIRAFNEAQKNAVKIASLIFENSWVETLGIEDIKAIDNKLYVSTWLDDGESSVFYFIHEVDLLNGSNKVLSLENGYFEHSDLFVVQDSLYFTARSTNNNNSKIYRYNSNAEKATEIKTLQNIDNILAANESSIIFEIGNSQDLKKQIYSYNITDNTEELLFYAHGAYKSSSVLLTDESLFYFSKQENNSPELYKYDLAKGQNSKLTNFGTRESDNYLFPWDDVQIRHANNSIYFNYGFKLYNYGFRKIYNLKLSDNSISGIEPYSKSGTNDASKLYFTDNTLYALVSDGKLGKEWFKFDSNHKKLINVKDFNIALEPTTPKCFSLQNDATYFIASNNNLFNENSSSAIYKYSSGIASLVFDLNEESFKGVISSCPVYINDNVYFFYKTTPNSYEVNLASYSLKENQFSQVQLENVLEPSSNDEILNHSNELYYVSKDGIYLYRDGFKKLSQDYKRIWKAASSGENLLFFSENKLVQLNKQGSLKELLSLSYPNHLNNQFVYNEHFILIDTYESGQEFYIYLKENNKLQNVRELLSQSQSNRLCAVYPIVEKNLIFISHSIQNEHCELHIYDYKGNIINSLAGHQVTSIIASYSKLEDIAYIGDDNHLYSYNFKSNEFVTITDNSPTSLDLFESRLFITTKDGYKSQLTYLLKGKQFQLPQEEGFTGFITDKVAVLDEMVLFSGEHESYGNELYFFRDGTTPSNIVVEIKGKATPASLVSAHTNLLNSDFVGVLSYQWYLGESSIPNANQSSYLIQDTDVGKNLSVNIDFTDTDGFSRTFRSKTITPYLDTDDDGIPNDADLDDDNDGYPDSEDAFPLDKNEWLDTDNDGTGNNADADDDNDGVLDTEDKFPLDKTEWLDTDNDGLGNNADTDDDNDGVLDTEDKFPLDKTEWLDTDNDGLGNNADADDDNDGVLDTDDKFPLDKNEWLDTDNDGLGNNLDTDDDNDGYPDSNDAFPLDSSKHSVSETKVESNKSSGGSNDVYALLFLAILIQIRLRSFNRSSVH
ncbi:TolB-like translocation protein [Pseudoalteromonas xiamenensis]